MHPDILKESKNPWLENDIGNSNTHVKPLEYRARINEKNDFGFTPLNYNAYLNRIPECKQLIKNGARLDIPNDYGFLPLHFACENGNEELTELFLKLGTHPEVKDNHGYTPMMIAQIHKKFTCIEILKKYGGRI